MAKRCEYCGRYFIPDKRVGNRQRSCGMAECKRQRKQSAQKAWTLKNPGYFNDRYPYVKEWRQQRKHRQDVIQDKIPPSKPIQTLLLLIPADKSGMIQDEIRLRRVDNTTFAAYG
ncbi:MAG TPA: hypothetical protein VEJ88_07515 [Dissulfurispiraceae bacterium]|nr:hypothetical protein [Dissulfurispiraceae bacterium]